MAGAVGNFIAAGTSIPFATFGLYLAFGFGFGFFGFFSFIALAAVVLMSVALVIQLIGFYGFWKNYGSQMGIATFLFGLVAIGIFLGRSPSRSCPETPSRRSSTSPQRSWWA